MERCKFNFKILGFYIILTETNKFMILRQKEGQWIKWLSLSIQFRIKRTITNQQKISGLRWWIFGGNINYVPQLILRDGKKQGGIDLPPIWRRIYYGYTQPIIKKINPDPYTGNGLSEKIN